MEDILSKLMESADPLSEESAAHLDSADSFKPFREQFHFPVTEEGATLRAAGSTSIYLCGNSLGLQPKRTKTAIEEELQKWQTYGVEGHFRTDRPWVTVDETVLDASARIVGAKASGGEVAVMNSLTANLHLLMVAFYKPNGMRNKIIIEQHAFPSDTYAVKSQILVHGLKPEECLVEVAPRPGEELIREEDILSTIRQHGDSVALVLWTGVQYYTGQFFNIPAIVEAAHDVGAYCGVDLAHAVGNVPLRLHEWGVDFAAWCSYKYLNSGPGGIAGAFVHERFATETLEQRPHFAGWWGHRKNDRFKMGSDFHRSLGAAGFQLSNPPVFQTAALRASLEVFDEAGGVEALRTKSTALTGYLEALIKQYLADEVSIITPSDPAQRGCQLSLTFKRPVREVYDRLQKEGVIADVREPHVMRVAPTPLYNSAQDCWDFVQLLRAILR